MHKKRKISLAVPHFRVNNFELFFMKIFHSSVNTLLEIGNILNVLFFELPFFFP